MNVQQRREARKILNQRKKEELDRSQEKKAQQRYVDEQIKYDREHAKKTGKWGRTPGTPGRLWDNGACFKNDCINFSTKVCSECFRIHGRDTKYVRRSQ